MEVDWQGMFEFSISPWELMLRGSIIYWLIFVLLRISGRRDMGSLGPTDMLLLVLIADAAQNGMAGEYTSVSDGAMLVFTLVFWSAAANRVAYTFPASRRFLEPNRVTLIEDGQFQPRGMRREYVSKEDLLEQLRLQGIDDISQVRRAYMEASGDVSVLKRNGKNNAVES